MTDRIIKIDTHPNITLNVTVTGQMVEDYRDCHRKVMDENSPGKDCEQCSWWKMEVDCVGMCTYGEMMILLEG